MIGLLKFFLCISIVLLVSLHVIAYTKRMDKTFWGGWNILNGMFLIFPYGRGGVSKEESNLVLCYRVSAALTATLILIIYYLQP